MNFLFFRVPYTLVLPFPPLQIWSLVFQFRVFSVPIGIRTSAREYRVSETLAYPWWRDVQSNLFT